MNTTRIFFFRTNGSIIILEHNGSGTIGLKLIMEPLVLKMNSNCHYNLKEKNDQIFEPNTYMITFIHILQKNCAKE